MKWTLGLGDVRERLRDLPDRSVQCVVTSPPYWGLRNYGTPGQLGLEPTPDAYVQNMVQVFREVRRVLKDDGVIWVNLGDSYNSSPSNQQGGAADPSVGITARPDRWLSVGRQKREVYGLKPKDLVGIPWRVAFALQADGWWLRSDIIWSKKSCMPESVTDRPTRSHEYIFLLTKSARYYYDADAIREPHAEADRVQSESRRLQRLERSVAGVEGLGQSSKGIDNGTIAPSHVMQTNPDGRNKRSVWHIATQPFPGAHFAVMPEDVVEPCILAGTSQEGCCARCGAPRVRMKDDGTVVRVREGSDTSGATALEFAKGLHGVTSIFKTGTKLVKSTVGWQPSCTCNSESVPCVVLDPFCGSGTTGVVAIRKQRSFIGIDLKPEYIQMARRRIGEVAPLFATEVSWVDVSRVNDHENDRGRKESPNGSS